MFCVMLEYHPMIGVDFHFDLIPPAPPVPPVPTPFEPHVVGATLNWVLPPMMATTVLAQFGRVMQRGTDIMNLIPHIPMGPGVLLSPAETAFSGSKSHFGPASVQACKKSIAAAVLVVVNLNLNCGTIPTPTGVVIAPNTVVTGMTWGDILGGVMAMVADCAVQTVLNCILAPLGPVGAGIAGMLLGSPLGFGFNANGRGAVGSVGRFSGYFSDAARGAGEVLGGDEAQGQADIDAAGRAASEDLNAPVDPNNPFSGWDSNDADRLVPSPMITNVAGAVLDSPAAEQF